MTLLSEHGRSGLPRLSGLLAEASRSRLCRLSALSRLTGLLLSPLSVFFSDVVEMITVILSVLMYLTPIFYPKDIVPERLRWIVRFNPLRSILEVFRDPIYYGKVPPLSHLTVSLLITLIAFALGAFAFRRSSDRIPFYI